MKRKSIETTKSPLKDKPLRNPGQSLDEQIESLVDEKGLNYALVCVLTLMLTALEWIRYLLDQPYTPIAFTILAFLVTPYALYKVITLRKEVQRLKMGRDGERAVGQYLELLRESGCRVFHDIVGEGYNIDHVVVAEQGVFAIETKTYSKPIKGEARIEVADNTIIINGFSNTDISRQVRAEANSLKDILLASTGKEVKVKPVVLFPGWYVDSSKSAKDLWILNPKALPTFIKNSPKIYSKEDMMLFTYHISRHIRTSHP